LNEGEVSELVTLVCYEEGVSSPSIEYSDSPHAEFGAEAHDHTDTCIFLPRPAYAREIDPEVFGDGRYVLVVLHELAHHIAWLRYKEEGHTAFMYAKLFQLCVRHGVDLVFALENERAYQPRATARGWNLFKSWALA
jgi:hypothetical protein